jgi:hypothetical protein
MLVLHPRKKVMMMHNRLVVFYRPPIPLSRYVINKKPCHYLVCTMYLRFSRRHALVGHLFAKTSRIIIIVGYLCPTVAMISWLISNIIAYIIFTISCFDY